ncbi:unnamed protein product [Diabrotica balteata]|uniref:Uncharacterized protein n=1 Tax=Diabrotica balteata TaxID=107213 RepID=A0A9N9XBC0_DIABA|nr:unnamed protein product [Diabrotica balteata]
MDANIVPRRGKLITNMVSIPKINDSEHSTNENKILTELEDLKIILCSNNLANQNIGFTENNENHDDTKSTCTHPTSSKESLTVETIECAEDFVYANDNEKENYLKCMATPEQFVYTVNPDNPTKIHNNRKEAVNCYVSLCHSNESDADKSDNDRTYKVEKRSQGNLSSSSPHSPTKKCQGKEYERRIIGPTGHKH